MLLKLQQLLALWSTAGLDGVMALQCCERAVLAYLDAQYTIYIRV